jgi:hypothetical protein
MKLWHENIRQVDQSLIQKQSNILRLASLLAAQGSFEHLLQPLIVAVLGSFIKDILNDMFETSVLLLPSSETQDCDEAIDITLRIITESNLIELFIC